MKRLLVTGAGGFLGYNICVAARERWAVFGTVRSRDADIPGVRTARLDLTDTRAAQAILATVGPDAVVHAAAAADPAFCERNPAAARAVNVAAAVRLAGLCAERGIPFVFISTDLVFDGRHPPCREGDPVNPVSTYGRHKAEAEAEVRQRHPGATVCRLPLMFGLRGDAPGSILAPMLDAMRAGRELRLFTDEYRTPVSGAAAAAGLLLALERARGILHLGGRERISRYAFGQLVQQVFDLPQARITPARQSEAALSPPRPSDVSLDSTTAFGLGYDPPLLRVELEAIRHRLAAVGPG
jgi:dTDP-4-dehydrorhamnose reductase